MGEQKHEKNGAIPLDEYKTDREQLTEELTALKASEPRKTAPAVRLGELSPTCRGGGFVRRLVFKFPPFQATLILTGVSTSPLLYRTVKSTTLLFLKIFNAPLTSALSNLPSAVLYSPLCTLFPLKL